MTTKLTEMIMSEARDWAEQAMVDDDCVKGGAVSNTDSPIEAQLLVAAAFCFRILGDAVLVAPKGEVLKPSFYETLAHPYTTLIIPQFKVKEYRLDFALFNRAEPSVKIAIECDGHNFHERTKEQAQRDKSRDRALQTAGYKVLRFTGSEIYRKPMDCAHEVRDAVFSAVEDAWMARG
ncbi:endonuclease domain-containing protein [Mesorhizobium sp. A556]